MKGQKVLAYQITVVSKNQIAEYEKVLKLLSSNDTLAKKEFISKMLKDLESEREKILSAGQTHLNRIKK